MDPNDGFEKINEYEFSSLTLNGFDLYDYTIVYSEDDNGGEKKYAELLRKYIVDKSGYLLNVISDKEFDGGVGKAIYFKMDPKMNGASVSVRDNSLYVNAAGYYEFSVLFPELVEKLLLDADTSSADIHIFDFSNACANVTLDICRAFSLCGDNADLDFLQEWADMLREVTYDIMIFDKIPSWFE